MGLTGKYDFKGIKRLGGVGLRAFLSSMPATAWICRLPFSETILELLSNWLANKGLMVLNIGAIYVGGEFDQRAFDRALDQAFSEIELKGGRDGLTAEQKKAIDDEVIRAARRFVVLNAPR